MNCGMHRGVKLLEYAMKVVEKVLRKRCRQIVTIDEMQFGLMPGKGTIYVVFILRKIPEEYIAIQKKLYMCFVVHEKPFLGVPRKDMELAMRKKSIPEALVRAVISLYKGAKTKVIALAHLSEELEVNVGVHQGSALSPLLFAIVVDVVTNEIMEGMLQEILCACDIVLIVRTMAEQQVKFNSWKSALECKDLKVYLEETTVMVSKIGQATVRPSSRKDPCGICGRKTMLNAVLCTSCGNCIHGRCAKIKKITNGFAIDIKCRKCKGYHKNVENQKEKLHDYVEIVTEF